MVQFANYHDITHPHRNLLLKNYKYLCFSGNKISKGHSDWTVSNWCGHGNQKAQRKTGLHIGTGIKKSHKMGHIVGNLKFRKTKHKASCVYVRGQIV